MTAGAAMADYTLNILHINDWHSRIEANNKYDSTCSAEEETKGECIGGAGRRHARSRSAQALKEGQNVLLLERRRQFPGIAVLHDLQGRGEGEFLNQMKFDAMALGNHEFDDAETALAPSST